MGQVSSLRAQAYTETARIHRAVQVRHVKLFLYTLELPFGALKGFRIGHFSLYKLVP
jgi:hypothetical protein